VIERLWRWRVAIMVTSVTGLAALLRFVSLSHPNGLVFDELYYVRGAFSLLQYGYEGNWGKDEGTFAQGDYSRLSPNGDYVVHPMVGKLLIALGMKVAGVTPFGWRVAAAVAGTVTVLIVALLARSMLRSTLWGGFAGLLLAIDGEAIALSRTALLDGFLTLFIVLGLAMLWLDRRWLRRRLDNPPDGWDVARAPFTGPRWWRLGALVVFGLAAGSKWSGLYFAAAFLVMSVAWEALDRRRAGYDHWLRDTTLRSALPGAFAAIVIIPVVYVATWANWFLTDGSYNRDWAAKNPEQRIAWMPEALQSLLHYHQQMLDFHANLTASHPYESHPNGWILQFRPTAFYWQDVDFACGAERCVSAIHALGNPVIWWGALAALCFAVWRLILKRDRMGLWMAVGVLAAWLPWVPFAHRTIFTFYSVAMAPFAVMLVAWAAARIAQPPELEGRYKYSGVVFVGWFLVAALLVAAFFLPLWTGAPIPYHYWHAHMWLRTWG
jgi:dolichyl-phosphate-mannose-protein mannosyltransferase